MSSEHLDVLVVGAGIAGIAAGYNLQTRCPDKTFAILEARDAIGGTWDLFRFPGVRSDSDMYTLGYTFNPWRDQTAIADGAAILSYIRETAAQFKIDEKIRFGHRLCRAEWSSEQALWTVGIEHEGEVLEMRCNFLLCCTGYYQYEAGYTPDWPDLGQFAGQVIHPQHWPEDYDYSDQRVVVIGSGATAVTLVPVMAEEAAHVTMLQRSPSYIFAGPREAPYAKWLHRIFPEPIATRLVRWWAIYKLLEQYYPARWWPERVKDMLREQAVEHLGPDYDVDKHFTPEYNPWDQRVCLATDGDLFEAIKAGRVTMVTDHITGFDADGIQLQSGERVDADLIVTATGLRMKILHGVELIIDGEAIDLSEHFNYKGVMLDNVPNLVSVFGYTNASWTMKAELACEYTCRLLKHMDEHNYDVALPHKSATQNDSEPIVDFTSGYIQRALAHLPKQGTEHPWRLYQNYLLDLRSLRFSSVDDGVMHFSKASGRQQPALSTTEAAAMGD